MSTKAVSKKNKKGEILDSVMAAVAPAPAPVGSHVINDRAMLVGLTIRRWHPHKTDRVASQEIADAHKSDINMGRYRKRLVIKEHFKGMLTVINQLRNEFFFLTLPWSDDGYRILSANGYFEFTKRIADLKGKFNTEVAAFIPEYPSMKAEAEKRLNGLFNEADYPSESKLREMFGIDVTIRPIPSGKDFRVDVGDSEVKMIREAIEEQSKRVIENAVKDLWRRLQSVLEHASKRLKEYSVSTDGKVEHTFRDSTISNIIELVDIIPALNITNDPDLVKFAERIRKEVTAHTAEELRDQETLRVSVATKADDILSKMAGYLS
jgi:hypothetical protein